jgi:hypothetical protein
MRFRFALLLVALVGPALAAEPKLIDTFDDWSAFADAPKGARLCYMGGVPTKEEGKYKERGKPLVLVTHRPGEKSFDVVEVRAGYDYKPGSEVEAMAGGTAFKLFTDGDTAWAHDAKGDAALVAAMKRGATLVVKGVSSRGTETTDAYSLKGFSAAHDAIDKACGRK